MRLSAKATVVSFLLIVLGCASSKPQMDAVQTNQARFRQEIVQLQEGIEKISGRLEELDKRISFLEGNLTANIADLQRSVDTLGTRLDGQEADSAEKLKAISADLKAVSTNVDEKLRAVVAENKGLLKAIEEARASSFTTGYEHFVESGETLGSIARSYGVTVQVVMDANDLDDPNKLTVGQKLFIPKE